MESDDENSTIEGSDMPLLLNKKERTRSVSFFARKSIIGEAVRPTLGALSVCFIAYFNVSGGPWGTEDIISSIGPLQGLIGIVLVAFVWGYPMVLITAEMSTRFPEDGGYSIWVAEAFGEFWGFQESYWSWISGVIDNSVYPVLAYHTLSKSFSISQPYLIKLLLTLLFSAPPMFFIEDFGKALVVLFLFVLLPFIVFSCYSFSVHPLDNLLASRGTNDSFWSNLLDVLPVLYWNFSGLDCVSTCAGEVKNPQKAYIKGLKWSLILISSVYVFTLGAAVIAVPKYEWINWDEGSLVTVMEHTMGEWMGIWVTISSLCGNMAMHAAELFEDSWQLSGMAETGLAPNIFAIRSTSFKTPVTAIAFSIFIICFLITLDFQQIIIINNFFSISSALLEVFAFIWLRISSKQSPYQYNGKLFMPASISGLLVACLIPILFGSFVLVTSFFSSWFSVVLDTVAVFVGLILYKFMKYTNLVNYER